MNTSQKLSNLNTKLASLPEALDYITDEVEQLEAELMDAKAEIIRLQQEVINLMKLDNGMLKQIALLARATSESTQISEATVLGAYYEACKRCIISEKEAMPEPVEPVGDWAEKPTFDINKLEVGGFIYDARTLDVWEITGIRNDKLMFEAKCIDIGQEEELVLGQKTPFVARHSEHWRHGKPQAATEEQPVFDRSKLKVGDFVYGYHVHDTWEILSIDLSKELPFICKCVNVGDDETLTINSKCSFALTSDNWRHGKP